MTGLHLAAAWTGILAGMLTGAALGLFFHREEWLGGYGTWRRRLLRLGHISLFGLALVNLAFAGTAYLGGWSAAGTGIPAAAAAASPLLLAGAVLMPSVCALAAWRKPLRHLFFLPVGSLVGAAALTLLAVLREGGAS
jgi:hypothetical protein